MMEVAWKVVKWMIRRGVSHCVLEGSHAAHERGVSHCVLKGSHATHERGVSCFAFEGSWAAPKGESRTSCSRGVLLRVKKKSSLLATLFSLHLLELLLFDNAQFFTHFREGGDTFVEVLGLVSCGNLNTDTGLVFRHYRIVETGNEDTLFLHLGSHHL